MAYRLVIWEYIKYLIDFSDKIYNATYNGVCKLIYKS